MTILRTAAMCTFLLVGTANAAEKSLRQETCESLVSAAKTLNVTLPIKINEHATLHSMLVICSAKMVIYTKVLDVFEDDLEDGWLKTMRTAWNTTMCTTPGIRTMHKRDWKFIDQLYFSDGSIYHVIANCKVKKTSRKKRRRRKRKYVKKK